MADGADAAQTHHRIRLIASALWNFGTAILFVHALHASAQVTPAQDTVQKGERVEVTGSWIKRIDAETSDYYVLGYYSKNPDATKRRRQVEVKIARKNATPWFRKEYVLKPPPKPVSSTKK